MTDLVVTNIPDAWLNTDRAGANYGSTNQIQLQASARRGFLLPDLGNILGRTVLDAYLVGHAKEIDAQTLTVYPVLERWSPGRVTWNNQPAVGTGVGTVVSATADG